ncbi:MAG: radical SAM protein [Actinomycetota bacterium]|nr:radical SAM protein [Actinomycetota bacterium]
MKIVFIQPRTFHTWEALNIGYIAAYIRSHGFDDLEFYSGFFDNDDEMIAAGRRADVVAFSCTSPQMKHALELAAKIKTSKNKVVFGGVHPSALPDEVLETGLVDTVVVGEGEAAFLDFLQGDHRPILQKHYISDLDALPFPDRLFIKQERNIAEAFRDNGFRIASILASRGCPYRCTFCASRSVWSRKVRFRSAENIYSEFSRLVVDLKIDFIKFSDDTFALKESLLKQFCETKIDAGDTTRWGCNVRVDTVKRSTLELMRAANCVEVWFGVESGSPKILAEMKKGITVEQVIDTFAVTKELGFYRRAYVLLGMPDESREDIRLTEKLIDKIMPDAVGFTILAPYPGTAYHNPDAHKNVDWSIVDEYENKITCTNHLTNKALRQEQGRLVKKYRETAVFRQKAQELVP